MRVGILLFILCLAGCDLRWFSFGLIRQFSTATARKMDFPQQASWLIFSVNALLQVLSASLYMLPAPASPPPFFQTVNKKPRSQTSHKTLPPASSSSEERANEWCSLYRHKTFPSPSLFANEQCKLYWPTCGLKGNPITNASGRFLPTLGD